MRECYEAYVSRGRDIGRRVQERSRLKVNRTPQSFKGYKLFSRRSFFFWRGAPENRCNGTGHLDFTYNWKLDDVEGQ